MSRQTGGDVMATALSHICLAKSTTDHIHGGQVSEGALSAARSKYPFPHTPRVPGSSIMFLYQRWLFARGAKP